MSSTPRPYTRDRFQPNEGTSDMNTNPRAVIALLFTLLAVLVLVLGATACQPRESDVIHGAGSSGTSGTVTGRRTTGKTYWLKIRTTDGTTVKVFVRGGTYRRCHKREHYPQCARKS